MIVFGRVLQGVAAGCIQPLIMVTILQVFPADRRGFAMGVYGMGLTLAVGLGPVLGGVAIEPLDWHIFLPINGVPRTGSGLHLHAFGPKGRRQAFDWAIRVNQYRAVLLHDSIDGRPARRLGFELYDGVFLDCARLRHWLRAVAGDGGETLIDVSFFGTEFRTLRDHRLYVRYGKFWNRLRCACLWTIGARSNGPRCREHDAAGRLDRGVGASLHGPFGRCDFAACRYHGGTGSICLGTLPMAGADANTPYLHLVLFAVVARGGMSFTMPFIMSTALRTLRPEQLNAGGGTINFCRQLGVLWG